MKLFHSILIYLFSLQIATAQTNSDVLDMHVRLTVRNTTIQKAIEELSVKYSIVFSYEPSEIPLDKAVTLPTTEMLLKDLLSVMFKNTKVLVSARSGVIILRKAASPGYNTKLKHTISGIIKDARSGETLIGATIYIDDLKIGAIANEYGFYSLSAPEGLYQLKVSSIGYKTLVRDTALLTSIHFDVELSPDSHELQEVVITEDASNLTKFQRGISKVDMKTIKELPSLFGEADVLRNILLLPGVNSMAELGGDFQVRGGSWDQNLMLLDEAPVYNSNHLFGMYSTYNPDIIKDIKFYKAGIPANYGGRISSVMDITQKDGNMKAFHLNGTVGLIASKLSIECPIVKDKASFIIAGRRSTIEPYMGHISNDNASKIRPYFYDVNAKTNYIINRNNRIFLSGYLGKDKMQVEKNNQDYGNITATLRYNHIFGEKLFSNTSLIYSNYKMYGDQSDIDNAFKAKLGLEHCEFKNEFIYSLSRHKLDFGMRAVFYTFHPGEQEPLGDSSVRAKIVLPTQHALESAVYVDDNFSISEKLELEAGVRLSNYNLLGPADVLTYQTNVPRNPIEVIGSIHYKKNQVVQTYSNIEPRASLKYNVTENQTVTLSYNRMVQYVQLVSRTFNPLPYDMWKPSNNYIKPLHGDQYSVGWFMHLPEKSIDISVESYYKTLQNVMEIKPGAETLLNETLDAALLQGKGRAYGVEFATYLTKSRLTGMVSYTWSRTQRKVDGKFMEEKINYGKYYPTDYDIPHKVTLAGEFKVSARFMLTANFMYQTGRPVTYPVGQYKYFNVLLPYYSSKNEDRYPALHRLDLGAVLHNKKKEGQKWESFWTFSIYNVYARQNYYYAGIRRKSGSQNTEAVKLWFFGIVPSVSFSFKF